MKTLEVLDKVLKGKRISASRERSYRNAFKCLNQFTEYWPEDAGMVNEWIAQMPENYSDETVEHYYQTCLSGGNYIQRIMGRNGDGFFRFFNAFVDADRPRIKKKHRRYFTSEQLIDCLKACRGEVEVTLASTLIDSTCRVGELVGLRGRDVGDGFFICAQGKTGQRRYRLDVRICAQLKALAGSEDGYVFKMSDGVTPANVWRLERVCRQIIKRAGITGKKVGAHTLRHSGASLVARKTQSALVVKALLQHDKIDTSMIYIHDVEDEIQQSVSPLGLANVEPIIPKQLMITDGSGFVPELVEGMEVVETIDLVDDMFPQIPEDVKIRPLLRSRDLNLIRELAVMFVRTYGADTNIFKVQDLFKRMLRKV